MNKLLVIGCAFTMVMVFLIVSTVIGVVVYFACFENIWVGIVAGAVVFLIALDLWLSPIEDY